MFVYKRMFLTYLMHTFIYSLIIATADTVQGIQQQTCQDSLLCVSTIIVNTYLFYCNTERKGTHLSRFQHLKNLSRFYMCDAVKDCTCLTLESQPDSFILTAFK